MDWNNIQYFEESDFDDPLYPGSGENIDPLLVFEMDSLRRATGWPIIIHTLLTTLPNGKIFSIGGAVDMYGEHGHSDGSYHLLENGCMACDWHFKTNAPYRLQYRAVEKMGFTGIGIYLGLWHWAGELLKIAFHTDRRPKSRIQRWCDRKDRKRVYLL